MEAVKEKSMHTKKKHTHVKLFFLWSQFKYFSLILILVCHSKWLDWYLYKIGFKLILVRMYDKHRFMYAAASRGWNTNISLLFCELCEVKLLDKRQVSTFHLWARSQFTFLALGDWEPKTAFLIYFVFSVGWRDEKNPTHRCFGVFNADATKSMK